MADTKRSSGRGLGPEAGGQSGDTEGLSGAELADSESVEELVEEGQAFEAGVVSGVENAPDADKGAVGRGRFPRMTFLRNTWTRIKYRHCPWR